MLPLFVSRTVIMPLLFSVEGKLHFWSLDRFDFGLIPLSKIRES